MFRKFEELNYVESLKDVKQDFSEDLENKKADRLIYEKSEVHNREVKTAMAMELRNMGLSEKYIEHLLNVPVINR